MNILIVCNGFKGTLSASEANQAIEQGLLSVLPQASISSFPMADGGQGSARIAGMVVSAQEHTTEVTGPDGDPVASRYWRHKDRVFLELAETSGLVKSDFSRPLRTKTTYGLGELIRHVIEAGAREVEVFVGGSGTNDGGVGLAKALGVRFYDKSGLELTGPGAGSDSYPGEQLEKISRLDRSQCLIPEQVQIRVIVDVDNPLCGPTGASMVYGPQKGGEQQELRNLDRSLHNLLTLCSADGPAVDQSGFGAAGGAGFGLKVLLGAEMVSGAPYFLDLVKFEEKACGCDLIITGEGKLDHQSIEGKLFAELVKRSARLQIPLVALVGVLEPIDLLQNLSGVWGFDTTLVSKDNVPSKILSNLARYCAREEFPKICSSCVC